jgi:DNA-binding LacI/PurR family transcriptional regulator
MSKRPPDESRPTMEAIARLAGVSKITVSRALRDSDLVRPELREHIREVARTAGYRVNLAARNLRNRRTQMIAVVVEKLTSSDRPVADPMMLLMIGSLMENLTPAGYALLLTTSDNVLDSDAIGADGVIMIGEGEDGRRARQVAAFGLPTVVWGAPMPGSGLAVVGSDNREGGRLAAAHMVETGRRRILFLGDIRHPEVAARHEGVRDVLSAAPAVLVGAIACDFSRKGGALAVTQALEEGLAFDAVIASSDYIAAGAFGQLIDRGLDVPGDVAVIGFDDIAVSANHRPPLSSIRQNWSEAGRVLSQTLLDIIADPSAAQAGHVLGVELVARETTAPAKG